MIFSLPASACTRAPTDVFENNRVILYPKKAQTKKKKRISRFKIYERWYFRRGIWCDGREEGCARRVKMLVAFVVERRLHSTVKIGRFSRALNATRFPLVEFRRRTCLFCHTQANTKGLFVFFFWNTEQALLLNSTLVRWCARDKIETRSRYEPLPSSLYNTRIINQVAKKMWQLFILYLRNYNIAYVYKDELFNECIRL